MDFNYVNIKTKGCEGWLNLFFGEHVIALVNNVWLADKIREKIDATKEPITQAGDKRCRVCLASEGEKHDPYCSAGYVIFRTS